MKVKLTHDWSGNCAGKIVELRDGVARHLFRVNIATPLSPLERTRLAALEKARQCRKEKQKARMGPNQDKMIRKRNTKGVNAT